MIFIKEIVLFFFFFSRLNIKNLWFFIRFIRDYHEVITLREYQRYHNE